jgi:hypothetical protein
MSTKLELILEGTNSMLPIDTAMTPTVEELVAHIEKVADIDGRSVVELALGEPLGLDLGIVVSTLHFRHPQVHTRRQCVTLHFEGEDLEHKFPASATWGHVHKFGCRKFTIAHDACANLELHLNTIDGPVANERKEIIGHHEGCIDIWLVKPGPEPNGNASV